MASHVGLETSFKPLDNPLTVEGVGSGSSQATQIAEVPIAVLDELGEFQTPMVKDSGLPALWGLES